MEEADAKLADGALSTTDDSPAVSEPALSDKKRTRWRRRMTVAALVAVLLAAALVLPGLINLSHYKRQIAGLMSRSMGRPVRMSGVELRLLPTPGFVLHDLAVSEDPQFGAEPILSARTVVASVRVLSLFLGRIEISRVSVDEASLNLVRSPEGRWNLETLMIGGPPGPVAGSGSATTGRHIPGTATHFPYLEATESRVNLKNGVEKSPFSLLETDLSLWQDAPGQWRVRLRGQPMRTDIPMSLADTGEVRLEASLQASSKSAMQLREMPLKLDLEWRNAQLGQLSRLLTGSDAGWRGDLTADVSVLGSLESAQTRTRLRATGVRREEFAPDAPLDFDANCSFRYQHSLNAAHDVNCNTAIGDGRLHLKAELPGKAGPPEGMLEVKDVPLQAGLDLLRTVRSGFAPGMQARGKVNGSLAYKKVQAPSPAEIGKNRQPAARRGKTAVIAAATTPGDLQGALTLDGAELSGGQLTQALILPEVTLTPAMDVSAPDGGPAKPEAGSAALTASFTVPLGKAAAASQDGSASAPLATQSAALALRVDRQRYRVEIEGTSTVAKLRELAYGFGWTHSVEADDLAGGSAEFDVTARGPWIAAEDAGGLAALPGIAAAESDSFDASLTLQHTEWHADYLLHPVELSRAAVKISDSGIHVASDFVYGKAKDASKGGLRGSAEVDAPTHCAAGAAECGPVVELRFGALEAGAVEAALLGAPEEKNLLSSLMDRMRSSDKPKWPQAALRLQADSLVLGPTTLLKPVAEIRFERGAAVVKHWEAGLLGGSAEGAGRFGWADDKPEYAFDGSFTRASAAQLGALMGSAWTGGPVSGSGNVQLSGRTAAELAASAAGTLHFDWQHGAGLEVGETPTEFDEWSGTAAIAGGKAELGENTLLVRRRSSSLTGAFPFAEPAAGPVKLAVALAEARAPAKIPALK